MLCEIREGQLQICYPRHGNGTTRELARDLVAVLLPCPFCGCEEPELTNSHTPSFWIECPQCGARSGGGDPVRRSYPAAMKAAVDSWNQRS